MQSQLFRLTDAEVRQLVEAGVTAPSGGNVQPWRVRAQPAALEIALDPARPGGLLDVGHYGSALAVGAFAEAVAVEGESLGLESRRTVRAPAAVGEPLVRFDYTGRRPAAEVRPHPLRPYLSARVTNRRLHRGPPLEPERVDPILAAGTDAACAVAAVAAPEARQEAARLLGRADAVRLLHREFHRELFGELRWTAEEAERTRDGIDVATLEVPPPVVQQLAALRSYEAVRALPRAALEGLAGPPVLGASHLGCLYLRTLPSVPAMVAAGAAVERLWLTATRQGVALQPYTVLPYFAIRVAHFGGEGFSAAEVAEVRELDAGLRGLFGLGPESTPVFVFRLARAPAPTARALRRPWDQVTEWRR